MCLFEKQRYEFVYLLLEHIYIIYQELEHTKKAQLRVWGLNISNQTAIHVLNPVIATPNQLKEGGKYKKPFFDVAMLIRKNKNIHYFDMIDLLIQSMSVKLDSTILDFILQFIHQLQEESVSSNSQKPHYIFSNDPLPEGKSALEQGLEWLLTEEKEPQKVYIAKLKLSPIEIYASFIKTRSISENLRGMENYLGDTFSTAVKNVDEAPIKLNAIMFDNVMGTVSEVQNNLVTYYKENLTRNILNGLKLLGSVNIIGNPTSLIKCLGTGIKDFFFKPIEGFVVGPIEGSKGVIEGTGSLIKNTTKGIFGSASKITSAFSKGLVALANDARYIEIHEERLIRDKPKTLVDGLGYGLRSAANSVLSGVGGLVEQPVLGYRAQGITGLLKVYIYIYIYI